MLGPIFDFLRRLPLLHGNIEAKWQWIGDLEVAASGSRDGLSWIQLGNGRIFHAPPQKELFEQIWKKLSAKMPRNLVKEALGVAWDATVRYHRVSYPGLPQNGGIVIEAGAFHGLKAIRFADLIGPTGKVYAIELMPENLTLLQRNIEENALVGRVIPISCGLWSEEKELPALTNGRQAASLVDIDGRTYGRNETIHATTLERVIDSHAIGTVDFLNVMVNGAEVEVLRGLRDRLESVRLMRVVSRHTRGGKAVAESTAAFFRQSGCRIVADFNGFDGRTLYASPERHAGDFEWIGRSGGNPEGLPALRG
jgi:FkbM family methyltransferase